MEWECENCHDIIKSINIGDECTRCGVTLCKICFSNKQIRDDWGKESCVICDHNSCNYCLAKCHGCKHFHCSNCDKFEVFGCDYKMDPIGWWPND